MISPEYISAVIAKLEVWREHDFHKDRQLADEVLIADGWQCEPDPAFEGGVRWFFGTNPQYSSSESARPHVIHDLNTALGVVPVKHNVCLIIKPGECKAAVWPENSEYAVEGKATVPTVAALIAALKAKRELLKREVPA
jgi:hypothetical protein